MPERINGMNYDVIGNLESDENLVFVHGSGCNRKFLKALAKQLVDFKCYLIDLPDHGESEKRNCTKVEDYVDAVTEFVSGLENVTIIGHSLGGTICLGVAAKGLPVVKRSVIISSGSKFDKLDDKILTMVRDQNVNWLHLVKCLGSPYSLPVLLDFLNFEKPEIILQDFKIDVELDLDHVLKEIHIPTLIMVGLDDILTLPEYSKKLKQAIPESRLLLYPRCRHMLPIARRVSVAMAVREFINN